MDKIETPEEFARKMSLVHDEVASDGTFDPPINKWSAMLTARDVLLRADERQKAAERLGTAIKAITKYYVDGFDGIAEAKNPDDGYLIYIQDLEPLVATILAEPEEAQG